MVTLTQFQNGVMRYIDNDVLPHLTGFRRVGLGIYAGLAANNVGDLLLKYKDHPAVEVLNVVDKDGSIDVDRLYSVAAPMFANGERYSVNIPMIGEMTVDRTDLEKLYQYIKG